MSHFTFLQTEWSAVHEAAGKTEAAVHPDPRAVCFYARRALDEIFPSLRHRTFQGELWP